MFDVIGIGTSPLMLMRAAFLASAGRRVLLCDRASAPGGAWIAPHLLGLANVENGVHLLENRPGLMRHLRDDLSIPMEPSASFGVIGGRRIPISLSRVLLQAGAGWNAVMRGEFDKCVRSFRSVMRTSLCLGHGFYYPAGGASAITGALCRRFSDLGGEIRHQVEINAIAVAEGRAQCRTSHGIVETARVLIGSRAFAPVEIDGEFQSMTMERLLCRTAVVRLRGATRFDAAYVEILSDSSLKRARDLTQFVRPTTPADERVLCVQYRRPFEGDDFSLGEYILSRLRQLKLLDSRAKLLDAGRCEVRSHTLTDRAMKKLVDRSEGAIEALRTTDFADGFVSESRRLIPALRPDEPAAARQDDAASTHLR